MNDRSWPRIGVLAIQGDYAAHADALTECGAIPSLVKIGEDLRPDGRSLDGLVLPGGESTTMLKFLEKHQFFDVLKDYCETHPVFSMPLSSEMLTAARSIQPSCRQRLHFPAAHSRWSSYELRALPKSVRELRCWRDEKALPCW